MAHATIGKLKPVHSLLLNPHAETKLSSCPHCEKPTFPRKFALLIHVEGWGPMVHGKTCKYCARCRTIMVQQDELEAELARTFQQLDPRIMGREYMILGVVESKTFKAAMKGRPLNLDEVLEHVSDIKKQYGLAYSPGGWYPKDKEPPVWPAHREQRIPKGAA